MVKSPPDNTVDVRDVPSIPGEGNGNLLQYSCLENSKDGRAWRATVPGIAKESDTTEQLTHTHTHIHSFSRVGSFSGTGVYNYPPSFRKCELCWALSKALDLGKGKRIQLENGRAIGNQLGRSQLPRMAGKLAAGERKRAWEERGRMLM